MLTCHSNWRFHHQLLPGYMGAIEWHKSELWHSSWHLCWGVRNHYCAPALRKAVESKERSFEFRYSLELSFQAGHWIRGFRKNIDLPIVDRTYKKQIIFSSNINVQSRNLLPSSQQGWHLPNTAMTHLGKPKASSPSSSNETFSFIANTDMTSKTALVVVDVQDGIANLTDGVPDADKIIKAISAILLLARQHNEVNKQREKAIEILFVHHDDKDPQGPLYRGKPTWDLVFPPRLGVKTERLVSKNVGEYNSHRDCDNHN